MSAGGPTRTIASAATGLLSTTHTDSVTGLVVTAAAVIGYFGTGWISR